MADKDKPKEKDAKPKAAEPRLKAKLPADWPPVIGMSVLEAAAALRTDDKTIRKLIQAGSIPARMVGRGYRIDPDALRQWVANGQDGRGPSRAERAEAEVEAYLQSSEGIGEPPHIDHSKP